MAGEWSAIKLGDFVSLQRGHDLPDENRRQGKVPVLGSFGITGWHDEARAHGPGVTIGRSGASIGVVNYCAVDFWPLNTALYVIDFHGNNPRFAYYFLRRFDFATFNSGSAQPSLNRNFIHPIEVRVPPRLEQDRIAELLTALDDKIELNRRTAQTLEAMARALFKSWFVDFDPIHAKAAGRPTALTDELSALFPDSFYEGGLPAGWSMHPARTVVDNVITRVQPSIDSAEKAYLPIDAIRPRVLTDVDVRPGSEAQSSLVSFQSDDILFGAMRPYFHKVCLAPFEGTTRTTVFVLRPRQPDDLAFCLLVMSEDSTIEFATSSSSGSTIPYAVWDGTLAEMSIVVPPPSLRIALNKAALPLLRRAQSASRQSRTLAEFGDTLLPKLISGELRIADAEKRIAAA